LRLRVSVCGIPTSRKKRGKAGAPGERIGRGIACVSTALNRTERDGIGHLRVVGDFRAYLFTRRSRCHPRIAAKPVRPLPNNSRVDGSGTTGVMVPVAVP